MGGGGNSLRVLNSTASQGTIPTGVAAERMAVAVSVVRQVGEGFVHCIVGVSWEVWPHAMPVIVIVRITAAGGGQTNVNGYPKGLSLNF